MQKARGLFLLSKIKSLSWWTGQIFVQFIPRGEDTMRKIFIISGMRKADGPIRQRLTSFFSCLFLPSTGTSLFEVPRCFTL